jgi:hypothetical protein
LSCNAGGANRFRRDFVWVDGNASEFSILWHFSVLNPRTEDHKEVLLLLRWHNAIGLIEMATDNLHWDLAARRVAFIDSLDSFCIYQDVGPKWVCWKKWNFYLLSSFSMSYPCSE